MGREKSFATRKDFRKGLVVYCDHNDAEIDATAVSEALEPGDHIQHTHKIRPCLVISVNKDKRFFTAAPFTSTATISHAGWQIITTPDNLIQYQRSKSIWMGPPARIDMILGDIVNMYYHSDHDENYPPTTGNNLKSWRNRRDAFVIEHGDWWPKSQFVSILPSVFSDAAASTAPPVNAPEPGALVPGSSTGAANFPPSHGGPGYAVGSTSTQQAPNAHPGGYYSLPNVCHKSPSTSSRGLTEIQFQGAPPPSTWQLQQAYQRQQEELFLQQQAEQMRRQQEEYRRQFQVQRLANQWGYPGSQVKEVTSVDLLTPAQFAQCSTGLAGAISLLDILGRDNPQSRLGSCDNHEVNQTASRFPIDLRKKREWKEGGGRHPTRKTANQVDLQEPISSRANRRKRGTCDQYIHDSGGGVEPQTARYGNRWSKRARDVPHTTSE
ncbi:hypothetical protein C8R47DRAFT_1082168 [Mycena vitilis]|nr:hypothetical protein C8R47DRAFT_1082168 [Mycena vitilis]